MSDNSLNDDNLQGFDWIWNVIPPIGWYHFLIVFVAGYAGSVDGYSAVFPVFAQYKQEARCPTVLDTEPMYSNLNLTFDDMNTLTRLEQEPYKECEFYKLDYSTCSPDSLDFMQCAENLNKNATSSCNNTEAIFDTSLFTSTVPSEFHIACGSNLNALATSLSFIGLFLGSYLAGFSDKFGRKKVIILAIGLSGFFECLQAAIPGYWPFVIIRILVQTANQTAYITYNVYACEVVGPKGRAYTGMVPNFTFAYGYMIMSVFSYYIPAWRQLTWLVGAMSLPFVFTYWIWPESPRWLYSVGRYEEGEQVLKLMMTKFNVKVEDHDGLLMSEVTKPSLTPDSAEARFFEIVKQKCQSKENPKDADGQKKNLSIFSLFTSGKYLCLTTLNICFQFIVIVMAYYGLSFSAGDLPGNIYVNNVINGAVEVAAYIIIFFVLNKLGRRLLTAGPLLFSGVCMIGGMILTQFVQDQWAKEVFRWLMFAGKFGVSGSFAVIWIYSAELFPTEIRGTALGVGSMAGRIGGICAPFINNYWESIPWFPPTIFGAFCIVGGFLLLLLPETSGRPLMSTIEEANAYYGKRATKMDSKLQSVNESMRSLSK